jgi:hypothetical protein
VKTITGAEFDAMAERDDPALFDYIDWDKAVAVRRVNVDFPDWMIQRLDKEAVKLNVSRQAVIKMWINDRLAPSAPKASRPRA